MIAWAILVLASAVLFYIIIGYPVLLSMRRGRTAPPVRKDIGYTTSVTVILAVYNGAAFIKSKLDTLLSLNYPRDLVDIIVVSDGSTDETEDLVRQYSAHSVALLRVAHGGKSAALNAAFQQASGEILFFTDVRQPLEPDCLLHLVANFADPTVGAVTGELQLLSADGGEQADMDLYWRYELWARRQHSRIDSLFNTTGCIYAMRRSCAGPIPADTLSDDAVLPLRAFFQGYRVIFDPEAVAFDYPAISGTEFRRRFRNLAGLWQVHVRFPRLFTHHNRMLVHFLSHKFGRLVMPWAIVAIFLSTLALPSSGAKNFLMINEAMLLVLAAVDWLLPRGFPLKRLSSPARTFLLMNLAALLALSVFFIPATRLWVPTRVVR